VDIAAVRLPDCKDRSSQALGGIAAWLGSARSAAHPPLDVTVAKS
jgi:hypothetical protein